MIQLKKNSDSFDIFYKHCHLLSHSHDRPCFFLGKGQESMEMFRGNFEINDYLVERIPLKSFKVFEKK